MKGKRAWYPEVHLYYGSSGSFSLGTVLSGLSSVLSPNVSGAAQIILAWAREYHKIGVGRPARNAWIANGYNWTGTFWSTGFSMPIPPESIWSVPIFNPCPSFPSLLTLPSGEA